MEEIWTTTNIATAAHVAQLFNLKRQPGQPLEMALSMPYQGAADGCHPWRGLLAIEVRPCPDDNPGSCTLPFRLWPEGRRLTVAEVQDLYPQPETTP